MTDYHLTFYTAPKGDDTMPVAGDFVQRAIGGTPKDAAASVLAYVPLGDYGPVICNAVFLH